MPTVEALQISPMETLVTADTVTQENPISDSLPGHLLAGCGRVAQDLYYKISTPVRYNIGLAKERFTLPQLDTKHSLLALAGATIVLASCASKQSEPVKSVFSNDLGLIVETFMVKDTAIALSAVSILISWFTNHRSKSAPRDYIFDAVKYTFETTAVVSLFRHLPESIDHFIKHGILPYAILGLATFGIETIKTLSEGKWKTSTWRTVDDLFDGFIVTIQPLFIIPLEIGTVIKFINSRREKGKSKKKK